jgi:hypothetical protein
VLGPKPLADLTVGAIEPLLDALRLGTRHIADEDEPRIV